MKEGYKKTDLDFETNSILKKIVNLFLIPILNSIPSSMQNSLRRTHKSADHIIEHATTHKAIEVLYTEEARHKARTLKHKLFHVIWFNTNNSKGLRNRLKLVKDRLEKEIVEKLKNQEEVNILNIASGSARGIIEVLEKFSKEDQKRISVVFLDKNPEALSYSKKLIKDKSIVSNLKWKESTIGTYFDSHSTGDFDIIEIVGLLDYFDATKVKKTFQSIYNNLKMGGVVLDGNISKNSEMKFVTNAVGWKMIYRSANDFIAPLTDVGFEQNKLSTYYEPLRIHFIVSGVK